MKCMFDLNKIIKETIEKFLISESLSKKIFHFCSLDALWGITKYDCFFLTSSDNNDSDARMSVKGR